MAHPYLALRPTRNGRVSHYAVAGSKNPLPLGMGSVKKAYIRENCVFADAVNFLIYHGNCVVSPVDLQEPDTTELAILLNAENSRSKKRNSTVQKYRDVLKRAVVMQDSRAAYVLFGIENQTKVHYAMPVRNMIYDALQYGQQVSAIAAKHKMEHDEENSKSEYLSGFRKEDSILPVVTLVIHFGSEAWDGPMSLHEMMRVKDKQLMEFVQDYRIHLIDPARITDEDLEKFSSSLREVLSYIKYSKDKKKLSKFLHDNPRMHMEVNAARVIQTVTNTKMKIQKGSKVIDVCRAIDDMLEESKERGRAEGEKKGMLNILAGLVKDGILDRKEAASRAGMTEAAFEKAVQKF